MTDLIPFDPRALSYLWFLKWREHLRCARLSRERDEYCKAAVIAQAEHVCQLAIEIVRGRTLR